MTDELKRKWERDIRIETLIIIIGASAGVTLLVWIWVLLDP